MDKKTMKIFHTLLREQRTQVVKRYFEHAEQRNLGESPTHGSRADFELQLLDKIDLALCRIAEGNYGECAICGRNVSNARLLTDPAVSLCTDCGEESRPLIDRCGA